MLYCRQERTQETSISIAVAAHPGAGRIITRNFLFLLAGAFSFYTSMWLVMLMLPAYVLELGGSESQIGLVLSVFASTALLSRPLVGRMVDTLGRRTVALAGCVVFALAPVLSLSRPQCFCPHRHPHVSRVGYFLLRHSRYDVGSGYGARDASC